MTDPTTPSSPPRRAPRWLYAALTSNGQPTQGIVQAPHAQAALQVICDENPGLRDVHLIDLPPGSPSLEELARQTWGERPERITAAQWDELAASLVHDLEPPSPEAAAFATPEAPAPQPLISADLITAWKQLLRQQAGPILGLGTLALLALLGAGDLQWLTLLPLALLAAPFVLQAIQWRHQRHYQAGLRAALQGQTAALRAHMQALTDAARRHGGLPRLRAAAWELAFYCACHTARHEGLAAARAELLAHPCCPSRSGPRPLGPLEYLLPSRCGDYALAAVELENLRAAHPERIELLLDLAITRTRLGQFEEARRLLARLAGLARKPPYARMYEDGIAGLIALEEAPPRADYARAALLLSRASQAALEAAQRQPIFWWAAGSFTGELALALARNGQPRQARQALHTIRHLAAQCLLPQRLALIENEIVRAETRPHPAPQESAP